MIFFFEGFLPFYPHKFHGHSINIFLSIIIFFKARKSNPSWKGFWLPKDTYPKFLRQVIQHLKLCPYTTVLLRMLISLCSVDTFLTNFSNLTYCFKFFTSGLILFKL